jgi:predicted transcriptional regulator
MSRRDLGVLRVGIAPDAEMKARTLAIARGEHRVAADEPRVWFTSLESFTRVLSERNRGLLALIAERQPASVAELAMLSGRAKSNLSRTLRTMERHGLVELQRGDGRTIRPRVRYRGIRLDLPVAGTRPVEGGRRKRDGRDDLSPSGSVSRARVPSRQAAMGARSGRGSG